MCLGRGGFAAKATSQRKSRTGFEGYLLDLFKSSRPGDVRAEGAQTERQASLDTSDKVRGNVASIIVDTLFARRPG